MPCPEDVAMEIPFLVEPIEGGRFRARAGEPLGLQAEGATKAEAVEALQRSIDARLQNGGELGSLTVTSGEPAQGKDLPFRNDELYKTDWVYRELREAMAEARDAEDAAGP
jgi:hypothetical protein